MLGFLPSLAYLPNKGLNSESLCLCLQPAQAVSQVAVGPRLLDFGKVSAASRNVRYLAVTNPLLQSVHVVLAVTNLPELKDTEPVSQVTAFACMCMRVSCKAHAICYHQVLLSVLSQWYSQRN